MLVEDDPDVAGVFAGLITSFYESEGGAEVTIVNRADDAVYRAMMSDWDLIIMDIGLTVVPIPPVAGMEEAPGPPPRFDGSLTALAIRGLGGERGAVPILGVSGGVHATDDKLVEAAKFAGGRVLRKPVLPHDLRIAIDEARHGVPDIEEGEGSGMKDER